MERPFISVAPADKKDGLVVGKLGVDGGDRGAIEAFANELAAAAKDEKAGNVDSMLIGYRGKLIFESYYRRGRANFPHYQMSVTKSYTALAIGRAIQLGLLKMEDLDKPAITFLKELDTTKLVAGADTITLAQAMLSRAGAMTRLLASAHSRRSRPWPCLSSAGAEMIRTSLSPHCTMAGFTATQP